MQPSGEPVDISTMPTGWSVTGQIDALTSEQLANAFTDIPDVVDGPIEVDLAGVTFIDSSGLRVLLGLAGRVTHAGGTVVIRNASKPVARLLAITRLESTFGLDVTDPGPPGE